MTTPAAERFYEAQHLLEQEGKKMAVYNPENRPIETLPVIYGFNNGGYPGWYSAVLLAEDGAWLGGHCCSSEAYMHHDLGLLEDTRPDRHETFREHYPHGYRMEWVPTDQLKTHEKFNNAIKLIQEKEKQIQQQEKRK